MINDKIVNERIKPYFQEAGLQLIIDIVINLIWIVLLAHATDPFLGIIIFVFLYLIVVLNFHYRIVLQAIMDRKKKDYVTEIVELKWMDSEYSFAGNRFGDSHVRLFYPKEMGVHRHKFKVICQNGKEKKLRAIISGKRVFDIGGVVYKYNIKHIKVTYLKRSKILLSIEVVEDSDRISKRRGSKDKVIFSIDVSL